MAASLSISDAGMILFMELIETDVVVLSGGIFLNLFFALFTNPFSYVMLVIKCDYNHILLQALHDKVPSLNRVNYFVY